MTNVRSLSAKKTYHVHLVTYNTGTSISFLLLQLKRTDDALATINKILENGKFKNIATLNEAFLNQLYMYPSTVVKDACTENASMETIYFFVCEHPFWP